MGLNIQLQNVNILMIWRVFFSRLNCENAVLKETLKLKTEEIKMLKSENASKYNGILISFLKQYVKRSVLFYVKNTHMNKVLILWSNIF